MEISTHSRGFELIGSESAVSIARSMKKNKSAARGIVIYGEKGLGKKTLAQYIAAVFLCTDPAPEHAPCGHCHSCRMILGGGHPDFIKVTPSLKSGGYKLDTDLRDIISDALIAPNESEYKVYLIADMDKTPPGSQNALLKLIEEPPAHVVIILTASSKEYFLPTILSRTMLLAVSPVAKEDCRRYLRARVRAGGDGGEGTTVQISDADIDRAIEAMGGNIGMCLEFLSGNNLPKAVETAKNIAAAIASKNEYEILKSFWACEGDREMSVSVLRMFMNILRDASLMRLGCCEKCIGCSEAAARTLADALSGRHISQLCEIPEKYIARINGNGNLALCLNAVCAEIKTAIS